MATPELRKSEKGHSPVDARSQSKKAPIRTKQERVRPNRDFGIERRLAFTIDENSIQMAAAAHLGPHVRLLDVSKSYFSSDDSALEGRRNMLRRAIDEYVSQFGGRRPTVSLTLTGPRTALRTIRIPKLKGTELQAALAFEAKRQIPFPVEDCWIDYRITEQISRGDEQYLKASVLAATKIAVEEALAPFEDLGLGVDHLYHTQDVIGRLLEPLPDFDETAPYTMIDIHRRSTEIAYFCGSDLEFYHVSSLGSSFLANRSDPTVFEYFAESLATEIQNSLDYYGGQVASGPVQEIYIYGDLSYTDDLISLLSDRFGFSFRRFPIERLSFVRSKRLPFKDNIAVCLPAVAAATNQAKIANLLPSKAKQRLIRKRIDQFGVAALIVLAGLFCAHWLASTIALRSARDHLIGLERRASEFRASEMFTTYNHLKRKLAANKSFMDKTHEVDSYLALNLKELTHLVPRTVRMYDLEFSATAPERNFLLSGLISTDDSPPELVLAELVENLAASPFYENVVVERHVKRREGRGFVLDFNLGMRGII